MYFFMNGLLMMIVVAMATAFLSSSAMVVDAFYVPSNNNNKNNNQNKIDIGSQIEVIHSNIHSSRSALLSGLRSLSLHPLAEENGGANELISIPKSCFTNPVTSKLAEECLKGLKITYFPTGCHPNSFNVNTCTINLSGAIRGNLRLNGTAQANATIACFDAIKTFTANVTNKCSAVISQVTAATTTTNINGILDAQCAIVSGSAFADCKTAIKSTASVEAVCPSFSVGLILQASSAVTEVIEGPLSALCIRDELDSSQSCLSGVLSTFTSFKEKLDLDSVSDVVLNGMCKPCMLTILDKIASVGGVLKGPLVALQAAVTAIQVLCTKDPTDSDKYCVKVFGTAAALAIKTKTIAPSNDEFSLLCSPCLNAMLMKAAQSDLFKAALIPLTAISVVCVKDRETNAYCGATMFSQAKAAVSALNSCTVGCTSSCKAAVSQLVTDQCCFASVSFPSFIPLVSAFLDDRTAVARLTAAATCPADITKKCFPPPISIIKMVISLPNIDAAIIAAKAAASNAVQSALKKDLSFTFGLDDSDVKVLGLSADPTTKGGIQATIEISVEASLRASYLDNFNQQLKKSGGLPLSNTAQAAQTNQATIVSGEPVVASSQGANNPAGSGGNGDGTSGVVKENASIIIIAIAIFTAFFAKF